MKNKDIKLEIMTRVIELDISKGHLKWRVSDLARLSKVSRPLIYYHFGKTKNEILMTSIKLVSDEYFGLSPERLKMLKEGKSWKSLIQSRKMFLQRPAYFLFYMKWRMTKSPLQDYLISVEKRYQDTLKENFPHLTRQKIIALHAILQSVVTAAFLTPEAISEIIKLSKKL